MADQRGEDVRRWLCASCEDVSVLSGGQPSERCMLCDGDRWRDDGSPQWPASSETSARLSKLEAALRDIVSAYDDIDPVKRMREAVDAARALV